MTKRAPVTSKPKIPAIELKDLTFFYPKTDWQLSIPAITLDAGQHLFVKGASGSGKTTLLNLLSGVIKAKSGELWIQGQPMHKLSASKRDAVRAKYIGVVFQQLNLIPYLSVLDNVLLSSQFAGQPRYESVPRAKELLANLGLEALVYQKAAQLSVGQQQRVAIARALLTRPVLLIADEPTSALDADNRDAFMKILLSEADLCATTVIFVSHDSALQHYFQYQLDMLKLAQGVTSC